MQISIDKKWVHEQITSGIMADALRLNGLRAIDRPAYDALMQEWTHRNGLRVELAHIAPAEVSSDDIRALVDEFSGLTLSCTQEQLEDLRGAIWSYNEYPTEDRLQVVIDWMRELEVYKAPTCMRMLEQYNPNAFQALQSSTTQTQTQDNKDNIMSNEETNTKSNFGTAFADAAKLGAKMAIAAEATAAITSISKAALVKAGVPELMLEESELLNKGVPLVSSILVLWLSENYPDLVPKSEFVNEGAKLALSQATQDTIKPLLKQAVPGLLALAASGEKLAKLEQGGSKQADDDEEEDTEFEVILTQEDVA